MSHDILLVKLKAFGVNNSKVRRIGEFLIKRVLIVRLNEKLSSPIEIMSTCGVPQGSEMGSLMFGAFVKGIYLNIKYLHITVLL